MSSLVRQPRDDLVLESLVHSRLLTVRQVAQLRGGTDVSNARKRMAMLEESGRVQAITVYAQPPPDITEPLYVWRGPGEPLPHAGKVSHQARSRYEKISPRQMTAYIPTNRTLAIFGLATRGKASHAPLRFKNHQATHDIGLAQCLVEHRHRFGEENHWCSEDHYPAEMKGWGMKVVDALILGPERDFANPLLAVDYLAKYGPTRVSELSRYLANQDLPFVFY